MNVSSSLGPDGVTCQNHLDPHQRRRKGLSPSKTSTYCNLYIPTNIVIELGSGQRCFDIFPWNMGLQFGIPPFGMPSWQKLRVLRSPSHLRFQKKYVSTTHSLQLENYREHCKNLKILTSETCAQRICWRGCTNMEPERA